MDSTWKYLHSVNEIIFNNEINHMIDYSKTGKQYFTLCQKKLKELMSRILKIDMTLR